VSEFCGTFCNNAVFLAKTQIFESVHKEFGVDRVVLDFKEVGGDEGSDTAWEHSEYRFYDKNGDLVDVGKHMSHFQSF